MRELIRRGHYRICHREVTAYITKTGPLWLVTVYHNDRRLAYSPHWSDLRDASREAYELLGQHTKE